MREMLKNRGEIGISDVIDRLNDVNVKLKDIAAGMGEHAVESARDLSKGAFQVTRETAKKIDRSAHENAWKYLGAASALSAIVGYSLGRCRD